MVNFEWFGRKFVSYLKINVLEKIESAKMVHSVLIENDSVD